MMIHFSGSDHHNNPGVMVFPVVLVCLDCGASRFNTPTKELRALRGRRAVWGCLTQSLPITSTAGSRFSSNAGLLHEATAPMLIASCANSAERSG